MEGDFELNKPGYYTVKIVKVIEDFDPDEHGNVWYNVQFHGDANTYMWLAKNQPEAEKKYYGHLEKTSSGKRIRFKSDKAPEGSSYTTAPAQNNYGATLGLVYKTVANIKGLPENAADSSTFWEMVKEHTEELILISDILNGVKKERDEQT